MNYDFFSGGIVHYSNEKLIIKSSGRHIIIFNKKDRIETKISLPLKFPRDFHFNFSLVKRLLRSDAKEVIFDKESNKIIIIRDSNIYLIDKESYIKIGKIDGDSPLFNSHCINNGIIYFGQYDQNHLRKSSKIYMIDKKNKLSVAYIFLPGEIRHIHSLQNDPFIKNRIWITTGDNDGECCLLYTDDNFKNINNIGDKSQKYRIVNLGFSKKNIIYGTDNLINQNYIYTQNRKNNNRIKVKRIKQTAWFLKQDDSGKLIIGTTVEKGKGCQVNYSSIYYSVNYGLSWEELIRIPKDIYPMPLFKWGSVSFSNGSKNFNDLFVNVEALKFLNGFSFKLSLIEMFCDNDLKRIEVKKKSYFKNTSHLMLIIYRLFTLYKKNKDIRYLNLLLKLIDWMPIYLIYEKFKLRKKAIKIYESFINSTH